VLLFHDRPEREFLLMKHANRFDLPKGHVDPGETEIECALREMEEETGIASADVELDPTFRYTQQYTVCNKRTNHVEMEKTLVIFLGRLLRDVEVNTTEHPDYQWTKWDPPHQIQTKTIDPLLKEAAEYLSTRDH